MGLAPPVGCVLPKLGVTKRDTERDRERETRCIESRERQSESVIEVIENIENTERD